MQRPFLTDGPAISGDLKRNPEDFRVVELPAYPATGRGDHLFVLLEKRGLNTRDAVRQLADAWDLDADGAGIAGMKDKHAVTRQWISLYSPVPRASLSFDGEGLKVLRVERHEKKLKTGHLRGNRFQVLLRGDNQGDLELAQSRLEDLVRRGTPAFYGQQRVHERNVERALGWVRDGKRPPRKKGERKFGMSIVQSAIFNHWLAARVTSGRFGTVDAGAVMKKVHTGGMFEAEDVAIEQPRCDAFETSVTGPMYGASMRAATGDAEAKERESLDAFGVTMEHLERHRRCGSGTRRVERFLVKDAEVHASSEGLLFQFTLPKGAYATEVLTEVTRRLL